jgi:hypothetical protein
MMAKKAKERYQTAAEVYNAVGEWLEANGYHGGPGVQRALSESTAQRAVSSGLSSSREMRAQPLSPGPKRKSSSGVRRAKPLEPVSGADDTNTNYDRPTIASPRIDTGSGSQPAVPGSDARRAATGSDLKARSGSSKRLPVAKALNDVPKAPSQAMPAIQIRPDESGSRRAETARPAPAAPAPENKDLLSRRRRTTVLFYAVVATGALALASVGALMLIHT